MEEVGLEHGQELGQTPGDGEGQGSLACCSPWGCEESDTTHQLMMSVKGVGSGGWQYVSFMFANPILGHILSELCLQFSCSIQS